MNDLRVHIRTMSRHLFHDMQTSLLSWFVAHYLRCPRFHTHVHWQAWELGSFSNSLGSQHTRLMHQRYSQRAKMCRIFRVCHIYRTRLVSNLTKHSSTTSGSCTTSTITNWASTISAYIKSIDSNHLVALGDEGFFNDPSNPSYPYQWVSKDSRYSIPLNGIGCLCRGSEGIDFDANLKVSTLDFGTFHVRRPTSAQRSVTHFYPASHTLYVYTVKYTSKFVLTFSLGSLGHNIWFNRVG